MSDVYLQKYCTFYLEDNYFGIEVEQVQEIIRSQPITPVALAPVAIKGLINLRGQIVTAVDLRKLLELPPRESNVDLMNIVVSTNMGAYSLLVDRVGDVLELANDCSEPPPENIDGIARDLVRRAYKLDGQLLLTMSLSTLLSPEVLDYQVEAA